MSMDQPQVMTANATILVASIVMIDSTANNKVIPCTANAKAVGVSFEGSRTAPTPDVTANPPESAQAGESLKVYTIGRTCLLRAGGAIVAGNDIKSGDSTGVGVACAETTGLKEYSVGQALESAAIGEYFKMLVMPRVIYTP